MIDDHQMDAALNYLADADEAAMVIHNLAVAENTTARIFAELFLSYSGGVEKRKMEATICSEYQNALAEEAEAKAELARHRARSNHADKIIEIWRTENANARNAERVR